LLNVFASLLNLIKTLINFHSLLCSQDDGAMACFCYLAQWRHAGSVQCESSILLLLVLLHNTSASRSLLCDLYASKSASQPLFSCHKQTPNAICALKISHKASHTKRHSNCYLPHKFHSSTHTPILQACQAFVSILAAGIINIIINKHPCCRDYYLCMSSLCEHPCCRDPLSAVTLDCSCLLPE